MLGIVDFQDSIDQLKIDPLEVDSVAWIDSDIFLLAMERKRDDLFFDAICISKNVTNQMKLPLSSLYPKGEDDNFKQERLSTGSIQCLNFWVESLKKSK